MLKVHSNNILTMDMAMISTPQPTTTTGLSSSLVFPVMLLSTTKQRPTQTLDVRIYIITQLFQMSFQK